MSNTCFLTVYILSKSGIVHTAFVCSFFLFSGLLISRVSVNTFLIIIDRLDKFHKNLLRHLHLTVTISELFNCPSSLKHTLAHCTSSERDAYFSWRVHVCDGTGAPFGLGRSVKTQCDRLQGCISIPLGVVTSLLRVWCFVYESE